jgi:hypothetical protein
MRDELTSIWSAIESAQLPRSSEELFGQSWDPEGTRFQLQETYIIDFKDRPPSKFSDEYGACILRLALAFHNSFGGLIIFGVSDREQTVVGLDGSFDIEHFNRALTDACGLKIECICREYSLAGTDKKVSVLLVPRRGLSRPVRLQRPIGPYRPGVLWVRDRHEVLEASAGHIALLYSGRQSLPSDAVNDTPLPIHRSLPPSPATMHNFIGRESLMADLWDWLVFGDQPRLYLHGPGGSGKSTLAFEFARLLADTGFNVTLPQGERIDYVLYLSAKETELDPVTGKQQNFALRQFHDIRSELIQILHHSGHNDSDDIALLSEEKLLHELEELFSSYTGLIVLDDIDALSRRGIDTGEEQLFMRVVCGSKRTRILYTLRFPPSHARRSALAVPGLTDAEFFDFLESCCTQFGVSPPPAELMPEIQEQTSSLPLLIETVVGLRKFAGFKEAIKQFRDRGGDDARRYLYQREYDGLSQEGKSREVLAALFHLQEPVNFVTISNLLGIMPERVRDALSECGAIFLSTVDSENGETLYQLTLPSRPFIMNVSARLDRADQIKRKVELFAREGGKSTAEEAALIVRMERMIRSEAYSEAIAVVDSLPPGDTTLANPRVLALTGHACANLGGSDRERARECFRAAESMKYMHPHMMRAWYFMETRSGYGMEEARRICRVMIEAEGGNPRTKSEFWGKLGWCYFAEAQSLANVSKEKTVALLRQSIASYLESLWVGREVRNFSAQETLSWLDRPARYLLRYLRGDLGEFLAIFEGLPSTKHDVDEDGAEQLMQAIVSGPLPTDQRAQMRLAGLFKRAATRLDRFVKDYDDYPGLDYLIDRLSRFHDKIMDVSEEAARRG